MKSKIPSEAIVISNNKKKYIAVWTDENKLKLSLLFADDVSIFLDEQILPDLVDALIELQNR